MATRHEPKLTWLMELSSIVWHPRNVVNACRKHLKSNLLLTTLNNTPEMKAKYSFTTKQEVFQFTFERTKFHVHATREEFVKGPSMNPKTTEKITIPVFAFRDCLIGQEQ